MIKTSETTKIVLDSNVYDELVKNSIDKKYFTSRGLKVIGTRINQVEHSDIPDTKLIKRNMLKLKYEETVGKNSEDVGYFGFDGDDDASGFASTKDSISGGNLIDLEVSNFVKAKSIKHERDRSLIQIAKAENAIFYTYDTRAYPYAVKDSVEAVLLRHDGYFLLFPLGE